MTAVTGSGPVAKALAEGLDQLGCRVSRGQFQAFEHYISLLSRWNRAYNLTAVRDPVEMVHRHLLDSLAVAPLLPVEATRVIDVGTGGGLPGVPLAILCADRSFDLLDSNGKKTRFLFNVKTELGLANMSIRHDRVEAWRPAEYYDVVISRAFASLTDMLGCCAHLVGQNGIMLAMKGQYPGRELAQLGDAATVVEVHRLEVPGLAEERHVVELRSGSESRLKSAGAPLSNRRNDETGNSIG